MCDGLNAFSLRRTVERRTTFADSNAKKQAFTRYYQVSNGDSQLVIKLQQTRYSAPAVVTHQTCQTSVFVSHY